MNKKFETKVTNMTKSRNNRHKTMSKFTDNPIQYMQLTNPNKYEHKLDYSEKK